MRRHHSRTILTLRHICHPRWVSVRGPHRGCCVDCQACALADACGVCWCWPRQHASAGSRVQVDAAAPAAAKCAAAQCRSLLMLAPHDQHPQHAWPAVKYIFCEDVAWRTTWHFFALHFAKKLHFAFFSRYVQQIVRLLSRRLARANAAGSCMA